MFKKLQYSVEDSGRVIYQNFSQPNTSLNNLINKSVCLSISSDNPICLGCDKPHKKIINGYCYRCSISLACCDICIVKPELCHFHQGSCRQPNWGLEHCFKPHYVYLAMSSTIKIGISRAPLSRWVDQGAHQACLLVSVRSRKDAGMIERYVIENHDLADKTNWRQLVRGYHTSPEEIGSIKRKLLADMPAICKHLGIEPLEIYAFEAPWHHLVFPVVSYPTQPQSWDLLKQGPITGLLSGICGQYLLFGRDNKVVNMRRYSGYAISITEVSIE